MRRVSFLRAAVCTVAAFHCGPLPSGAEDAGLDDELGCDGKWAQSPLCVERARALEARAKIESILSGLAAVDQPPWPPADLAAANALYDEGAALFRDEYFGDAAVKFEPALEKLKAIRRWFEDHVANTVAEAQERLASEEFADALAGFRRVLVWTPDDDDAAQGARRAETGQLVEQAAKEAIELVGTGNANRARTLLAGVPADFPSATLAEAQRALREFDRETRLKSHVTAGHAALDRGDWKAATEAFRKALGVDPASAAARDGLAEAGHGAMEDTLAALRQSLAVQLAEEAWPDSIATIREIGALAPDAPEVTRLPELERLAELENRLDLALADSSRAAAQTMRTDTRAIIAATAERGTVGERIHAKGRELEREFDKWTTPVRLEIRSDGRTDIRLRPGRRLGRFRTVDLEVYPGAYTLIGRRDGFREKKVTLSVEPGSGPTVLELVCDERF